MADLDGFVWFGFEVDGGGKEIRAKIIESKSLREILLYYIQKRRLFFVLLLVHTQKLAKRKEVHLMN